MSTHIQDINILNYIHLEQVRLPDTIVFYIYDSNEFKLFFYSIL